MMESGHSFSLVHTVDVVGSGFEARTLDSILMAILDSYEDAVMGPELIDWIGAT